MGCSGGRWKSHTLNSATYVGFYTLTSKPYMGFQKRGGVLESLWSPPHPRLKIEAILDDPFASVDVHTGRHIFEQFVLGESRLGGF